MKITLQCDCTGSDGVIQDLTIILLSLESELRYSGLTKTHQEKKKAHSCKTQEKANFSTKEVKKTNLRGEYLPTIAKIVLSVPPRY